MKLVSFRINGADSFGIASDNGVIDLGMRMSAPIVDLKSLIEHQPDLDGFASLDADYALNDVELLPVIPNPAMLICVGLNTYSHLAEYRERHGNDAPPPPHPWLFLRLPSSAVGHGQPIEKPYSDAEHDYEGEIAIIIGKPGRHIQPADALKHVAGYSCFNEGSIRDYQRHAPLYTAGKNFPKSGAFGPWMMTADEAPSPEAMAVTTRINGQIVQDMPYSDLIFKFEDLISYISSFTNLSAGDVIVTGTGAGVGAMRKPKLWLNAGDVCEVEVSGVGTLRNDIIAAPGVNPGAQ